jgi:hypothetical protein
MAEKSLADRVAALEVKVGNKTLQEQFREQGEMLDERFLAVHHRLNGIATDVTFLKRELIIVREGISILLKRSQE